MFPATNPSPGPICVGGMNGILTQIAFNTPHRVGRVGSWRATAYMQKAGDCGDISPQFFLDFPQNFRLRTRNQYCTQAIAWGSTILDGGSTILDGGSTILDGSSTIFCRFSPFFIDFHDLRTFVAIYILSRFTHFFRKFILAKIAFPATSHVFCMYAWPQSLLCILLTNNTLEYPFLCGKVFLIHFVNYLTFVFLSLTPGDCSNYLCPVCAYEPFCVSNSFLSTQRVSTKHQLRHPV